MVVPVVWREATPVFYRIREDTSVDLADIERKIDARTRAIVVPHFFGFPQDGEALRMFCDRHGLILIEDCAHAFFGSCAGRPLGSFGDYAIASPWKFFPTFDGGLIVSSKRTLEDITLDSPGAYFDAKAALNSLEYAFEYGRLKSLKVLLSVPLFVKERVWQARRARAMERQVEDGNGESDFPIFDPRWVNMRASLAARFIVETAAKNRIVANRRRNYARLARALDAVVGCRALFPELPEGVVPHVFPLLVDEPERVFPMLKERGVPVIRFGEILWPGVDAKTCGVAADYSRRIFQLPCHQDLSDDDTDWISRTVSSATAGAALI